MNSEVMQFFGLNKPFHPVAFLETETVKQQIDNIKAAIHGSGIIALTGMVGTGKTTLLWKIQQQLQDEKEVVVCRSLSTDKKRVNTSTLYTALFFDLAKDKNFKAPSLPEQRERKLLELVYSSGNHLTVILAGHPKLGNDLRRPVMEEIGARAQVFQLNHWVENKANYGAWLLKQCGRKDVTPENIITLEAMDLLVNSLVTPLQINHFLTQAMEQAYQAGTKLITSEIVQSILAPDLEGISAKLARSGYNLSALCEVLNARPSEVRAYLLGQLNSSKLQEFNKEIYKLGVI